MVSSPVSGHLQSPSVFSVSSAALKISHITPCVLGGEGFLGHISRSQTAGRWRTRSSALPGFTRLPPRLVVLAPTWVAVPPPFPSGRRQLVSGPCCACGGVSWRLALFRGSLVVCTSSYSAHLCYFVILLFSVSLVDLRESFMYSE